MTRKNAEVRRKILEFLRGNHEGKTTREVTEALNLSFAKANHYLASLALEGKVKRKLKSPKVALWYIVEEEG